jgi:hypothetical protein
MAIIYQHSPNESGSEHESDDEAPQAVAGGHRAATSWVLEQDMTWKLQSIPMLAREVKDIGAFRLTANTMASVSLGPASEMRQKPKAVASTEGAAELLMIEAQLTLTGKLSNRTSALGFGVCILTTYASSRQVGWPHSQH